MAQDIRLTGEIKDGRYYEITCRFVGDEKLSDRTSRRSELVAKMYRRERREDLKALIHYLYNHPFGLTHEFTVRRQTTKGLVTLHQSLINNTAKYNHPTEQRFFHPKEISASICNLWQYLITNDESRPWFTTMEDTPGEIEWMFWAGALIRRYHDFTLGGVFRAR